MDSLPPWDNSVAGKVDEARNWREGEVLAELVREEEGPGWSFIMAEISSAVCRYWSTSLRTSCFFFRSGSA